MITRNVTIEREGAYWLVRIDGTTGLTQARRYGEVELMAREYIALTEDVALDQVTIGTITVAGASEKLAEANSQRAQANELEAAAAKTIREVATTLRSKSVPLTEIGTILGVSHQRAHQLVST